MLPDDCNTTTRTFAGISETSPERFRIALGLLRALTIRHIKVMIFSTSAIPRADLARFIISGVDGLTLQFISDHDTHRARRDLDHLIAAVITLAGITPST
jgi:hypothetical protein